MIQFYFIGRNNIQRPSWVESPRERSSQQVWVKKKFRHSQRPIYRNGSPSTAWTIYFQASKQQGKGKKVERPEGRIKEQVEDQSGSKEGRIGRSGINFIYILWTAFSYKLLFAAFLYIFLQFCFFCFDNRTLAKICLKMRIKLTTEDWKITDRIAQNFQLAVIMLAYYVICSNLILV